ncbi:hypothetical protein BH11BAC6_BH11BAC6_06890 [soil metagenome]
MKMMITCKEATKFISQKEEGKLSLKQSIKLWLHMGICGVCKFFYRQNKIIIKTAPHLHEHTNAVLTASEKEALILKLQQLN